MIPLLGLALGGGLEEVRPRSLAETLVRHVELQDGRLLAADGQGQLWMGKGRLEQVSGPGLPVESFEEGPLIAVVRARHEGLRSEAVLELLDGQGKARMRWEGDSTPTALWMSADEALALLPGALVLLRPGAEAQRQLLPALHPLGLEREGDRLRVELADGRSLELDATRRCPLSGFAAASPWEEWRYEELVARCGGPAPSKELADLGTIDASVTARRAALAGDGGALVALGYGGAAVERFRPARHSSESSYTTRTSGGKALPLELAGGARAVVFDPDPVEGLTPWAVGAAAPACQEGLTLMVPGLAAVRWWRKQLIALPDWACIDRLRIGDVGTLGGDKIEERVWYMDTSGKLVASRKGDLSADKVALDLARSFRPYSPLGRYAELPQLAPIWELGPGPTRSFTLDVDGTVAAGTGWELVRAPLNLLRVDRQALPGPLESLAVARDGRFLARVGGREVLVDLEKGRVSWGAEAEAQRQAGTIGGLPAPPAASGWVLREGRVLRLDEAQRRWVAAQLPLAPTAVHPLGTGAVVVTERGLIGIDEAGKPHWRLSEIGDWTLVGNTLLAATAHGLRAYRPPQG